MPEELWDVGDNKAVDLAATAEGQILLVRRGDGGGWALPGGFVDPGESDVDAMVRELREETGVTVGQFDMEVLTDRIPVNDPRNRPDRWITTRLGLARLPRVVDAVGGDDAADARWVPLAAFDDMDEALRRETGVGLYPAHCPLIAGVAGAVRRPTTTATS